MLIVALYRRSLLSGIHHAYQVRVLLAVMQARSGCSVPNRTVLTHTARWKLAIIYKGFSASQARFYGGAQKKSKAPSVKAVIMAFYCRFGKLSSALWFAFWRSVSISMCFCSIEQCS